MTETQKESDYFYIWKALCCCLVIVIHYPFPGTAGEMILAIARISVPFFFAVSGWYLFRDGDEKEQLEQLRSKLLKTVRLTLRVGVICIAFAAAVSLPEGKISAGEWFAERFNIFEILHLLVFDYGKMLESCAYHLWYLFAMINCYAVLYCGKKLERRFKRTWDGRSVMMMLLVTLFILEAIVKGHGSWYRNWLFVGMPFILMGWYARQNMLNITRIPIFCGAVLSVAESILFGRKEIYLGTALTVLLILQRTHFSDFDWLPDRMKDFLVYVGKNLSSRIYYYHVLVLVTLQIQTDIRNGWLPILVLLISFFLAELLYRIEMIRCSKKAA